jgi:nucleolar pre-ribosomal-associated protein 1
LRLSLLPGVAIPRLPNLVTVTMDGLKRLESELEDPELEYPEIPTLMVHYHDMTDSDAPPYRSRGLHQPPVYKHQLHAWVCSVEALVWRVVIRLEEKHPAWDGLTCRLLLWRSIVGGERHPTGEWVHREVVKNLLD